MTRGEVWSGSGEVTREEVGGGSGSGEVTRGEVGSVSDGVTREGEGYIAKRPRLSDVCTIANEPVQAWLDNLPRDDEKYVALLLYSRLPTFFGLSKTNTAAIVGEVLHRNERNVRRWVDDFMANDGEFSDSHFQRNNTLIANEW